MQSSSTFDNLRTNDTFAAVSQHVHLEGPVARLARRDRMCCLDLESGRRLHLWSAQCRRPVKCDKSSQTSALSNARLCDITTYPHMTTRVSDERPQQVCVDQKLILTLVHEQRIDLSKHLLLFGCRQNRQSAVGCVPIASLRWRQDVRCNKVNTTKRLHFMLRYCRYSC